MIQIRNLSKTFEGNTSESQDVHALRNVNLDIPKGSIYGIIGMSGAGKSTLVRSINMLERPTEGQIFIDEVEIATLSEKDLLQVRRDVTMIFQHFNLMNQRTVIENIMLPLELAGIKDKNERYKRAIDALKLVELLDKENNYPSQLSGGQKQRIAIARALVTTPKVLLCDEATSALDPKTSRSILQLLKEINKKYGITIIMITHQMSVVEEICDRVAILDDGSVVEEGKVSEVFSNPKSKAARRLVYPDGYPEYDKNFPNSNVVRVVFNGAVATKKPLIARMATQEKIEASIISAQTKSLDDKMYGNLVLLLPEEEGILDRTIKYLSKTPNIQVQVVKEVE